MQQRGPAMTPEQMIPAATIQARTYNSKLRYEVFSHYCGGEPHCQCPGCKTTFIEFLQLDHVNGDGAAHRKANDLGTGGPRLWRWVRANGYPTGRTFIWVEGGRNKCRWPSISCSISLCFLSSGKWKRAATAHAFAENLPARKIVAPNAATKTETARVRMMRPIISSSTR